ncbi:hypothetical protein AU252_10065 [Pseudarthrobacter sulfonivorans]|uniref:Esterase Ig-like N-terminal domain-containing protein n=1 Tax=Pseudarthrobacter sulfonivorans TaxID=121292 RepID=A0A0U3QIU5_9MICC|nr:hypothetical protein [Pseudarthrobacter sulfonivorans]ALV41451.1 hypothetical protein AU252_10065 [Pseudarthrobacter sulfonivorans]
MLKHRKIHITAVAAAALASTFLGAGVANADSGNDRPLKAIDSTVITEVTPLGLKVTGLAVEYNGIVDLGAADIDESSFLVDVTLNQPGVAPLTGERAVVNAFTSSDIEVGGVSEPGKYIILELDENDPLARASYDSGRFTTFYDLTGSYDVSQTKIIEGANQRINAHPGRDVANSGVRNLIVDEYDAGTFSAQSGVTLPYRFFTPEVQEERKYPLVVTLHGYGESGTNNLGQIAGNQISVAFADPKRQESDPSFVLSPQADPTSLTNGAWWRGEMQAGVVELVKKTIAENPAIDPARVYLTGLSMGSYGSWGILPANSELFAGALLVCGSGNEAASVATLGDFPIWAVHSADDVVVPYDAPGSDYRIFKALEAAGHPVTWSEWAGTLPDEQQEALAEEAHDRAAATGSQHLFTTFPAGTTPVFNHFSWVPTYTNDVMLDWLFEQ